MAILGRRVAELFFTKVPEEDNIYVCRCGKKRNRCGTGCQNLLTHVQSAHPDDTEFLLSDVDVSQSKMEKHFEKSKSAHVYGWLDYIVSGLMPLYHVQKPVIRKHIRQSQISLATFKKYMTALIGHVEPKISCLLPFSICACIWRVVLRFYTLSRHLFILSIQ